MRGWRLPLLLLLLPAPIRADDVWTAVEPGIQHLHRSSAGPLELDALVVDLCDPGLVLRATGPDERAQTTGAWAAAVGARAAVNGDFFSYDGYVPIGLAVGSGARWPDTADGSLEAVFAAGADARSAIRPAVEALGGPEPWMTQVVSGRPNCLVDGQARYHDAIHFDELHPRSAVGLGADGRRLVLLVIDGRSQRSVGATTETAGRILAELGAEQGLNLDGGGSTTLWLADRGVINQPSGGSQRVVANHLAVLRRPVPPGEPSRCCDPQPTAGASGTFADVADDHWALDAIEAVAAAGISNGCQADPPLFCPQCRLDRAAAVAFLTRALPGGFDPPAEPSFSDVPADHPLYAEIEHARAAGLTRGCASDPPRFCPALPASRAQVAVLTARARGWSTAAPAAAPFADVAADHWAAGAIAALVDHCVAGGCGPDTFCPDRSATRAEMAVIAARAFGLVATGCQPQPDGGTTDGADGGADGADGGTDGADSGDPPDGGDPTDAGAGADERPDAGDPADAGPDAGGDAGADAGAADDGAPAGGDGCGCAIGVDSDSALPPDLVLTLLTGFVLGWRRRRKVSPGR